MDFQVTAWDVISHAVILLELDLSYFWYKIYLRFSCLGSWETP